MRLVVQVFGCRSSNVVSCTIHYIHSLFVKHLLLPSSSFSFFVLLFILSFLYGKPTFLGEVCAWNFLCKGTKNIVKDVARVKRKGRKQLCIVSLSEFMNF